MLDSESIKSLFQFNKSMLRNGVLASYPSSFHVDDDDKKRNKKLFQLSRNFSPTDAVDAQRNGRQKEVHPPFVIDCCSLRL